MQKKRLLFVTSTLEIGGSETKIVRVSNALASAGYTVSIAYLNAPDDLLKQISADVLVTHLRRRGKYSLRSMFALRKLLHGEDLVVAAVNFYPLLYMVPAGASLLSRRCTTVCLVNTTEFSEEQKWWGRFYAPFLRQCDRIVYGCESQQRQWVGRYGLSAAKSSYIYNGVDCERFSPAQAQPFRQSFRERFRIPVDAVVVGSVGRFAPEKNFELLIRAIERVGDSGRSVYLMLVGEGRERAKLERVANDCGIADRVILPGLQKDVRPALSAMDIFALPSRAVETFSNATLEAMGCGLPVIVSNIGGASEMVSDGEDGFLFPNGDLDALVSAILQLYESDQMRMQFGKTARQTVVTRFSFEKMLNQYKALLSH